MSRPSVSVTFARAAALQSLVCVASFVTLFITWKTQYGFAVDSGFKRVSTLYADYGLLFFNVCSQKTFPGVAGAMFTSCYNWQASSFGLPGGYSGDFLGKNAAVIAFMVMTIALNAFAVWVVIDCALSGKPVSTSYLPEGVSSVGTALWLAAASAFTSFISWVVYASTVTDDRAYFSSAAAIALFPGGSEVSYGAGFGLTVFIWIASLACAGAFALTVRAAHSNAAIQELRSSNSEPPFMGMQVESGAIRP